MSDPRYARSFDGVAEQYERARPEYADEAVDWLVEELRLKPGSRVLDLAAGTGKLTRQLVRRGLDVIAVEPSDEMRAVLERAVPEAEALAGTAEKIPLRYAWVDAVTVGQAFHWFDQEAALAEMNRVVRHDGGGIALLWNRWDEEDPLLSRVDALLAEIRPPAVDREELDLDYREQRTFRQRRSMTIDAIVEWAASTSGWINAPVEKQRELEAEIRRLGEGHGGEVSIATDVIVGRPKDPHTYTASLIVGSDSLPLAEITRRLGEPTRGWDIGEPVTLRYPDAPLRKRSVWSLESRLDERTPLDAHVAPLLDFAESRRAELDELRDECWIEIFCGVFSGEDAQGGFAFEPELLTRLADLGVPVVFDMY